jgi:hypothetical protein
MLGISMRILGPRNGGVAFANIDGNDDNDHALGDTNGRKTKKEWLKDRLNITRHKCGQKGHYARSRKKLRPLWSQWQELLLMTLMTKPTMYTFNSYCMRTTGVSSSTKYPVPCVRHGQSVNS